MTEGEIKKIVREMLKSEMDKMNKKMESMKDEISILKKESLDEEGIKKIVRKMFINHYKWLWEKSSIYINKI